MSKTRKQATDNGAEDTETPKQQPPAMANPFGDLDQVRQILFGAESQEINNRLVALEKHFTDVIAALTDTVNQRFDAVEASLKKQGDTLSKRLNKEREERDVVAASLSEEIQQVAQALQDNRVELDNHIADTEHALRTALNEEADKALKDRTARFKDLSKRLEQTAADLGDAKTDRHGLADLLDHLSAGLRNSQ